MLLYFKTPFKYQAGITFHVIGTLIAAVPFHTSLISKCQSCHFPKNNCDCSNWIVPSQYPLAVKQQLLRNL